LLGRVLGAHGVRGQVRVRYFGDGPENILGAPRLAFAEPAHGIDSPGAEEFEVAGGAPGRRGEVRLTLRGIEDRDAAERLKGRLVAGEQRHLSPLPEGEFYWYELIGCRVCAAGGRTIGTVKEIWETGAHDVLVVEGQDGRTRLIPTARDVMKEVDVRAGRIVVEDLPGLLDPIREEAES
jgi:16S rRNA processing protein RimM